MSKHSDTHPTQADNGAVLDFSDHKSIATQAAEWLAKLDAESPSAEQLSDFKQWVNASESHRKAFEALIEFWDDLNILTQAILPRELAASIQPAQTVFRRTAAAFAVSLLAIAAVLFAITLSGPQPTLYTTGIGEQKTIELADHSTVQLNTNSRLQVDYSGQRRHLHLLQGEAHFSVAHNPDRPFEVFAGNGLVRAIGTAFSVHIRKIDIEVIVTEGTVEIARPEPDNAAQTAAPQIVTNVTIVTDTPVTDTPATNDSAAQNLSTGVKVSAGNKVMFNKDLLDEVKLVVASQIEEQLSWRQGMLLFKGEPLQNVVDEVSRYTQLKIIIPERSTRELTVGGLFKVGDTASLFEALRDGFGIHAQEVSSDVVYLISDENR